MNQREQAQMIEWPNVLKTLKNVLIAVPIIFSFFATPVFALEQWRCTTESFKGFDDRDAIFVQKNLRKQFLITVTEKEVLVKTISKEFKDTEDRYSRIGEGALTRFALNKDGWGYSVIALPSEPERVSASDGFFNATISLIDFGLVNSWLLRCVE